MLISSPIKNNYGADQRGDGCQRHPAGPGPAGWFRVVTEMSLCMYETLTPEVKPGVGERITRTLPGHVRLVPWSRLLKSSKIIFSSHTSVNWKLEIYHIPALLYCAINNKMVHPSLISASIPGLVITKSQPRH